MSEELINFRSFPSTEDGLRNFIGMCCRQRAEMELYAALEHARAGNAVDYIERRLQDLASQRGNTSR